MDIEEAAELMVSHGIRRLPMVDDGRLTGIVTLDDLAARIGDPELAASITAQVTRAALPTSTSTIAAAERGVSAGARRRRPRGRRPGARRARQQRGEGVGRRDDARRRPGPVRTTAGDASARSSRRLTGQVARPA